MRIALIGYGKMGRAIEEIALQEGHEIGLKINSKNQEIFTTKNLQQCDVAIEFSTPETAVKNILNCMEADIPVISGTTAWLEQYDFIKNKCAELNGAFLYASNFSIGVNIFFAVNAALAKMMSRFPTYHPSIEEIHHTQKKDSPSGTAITLAQQIISSNTSFKGWNVDSDEENKISIHSKRIDPAPGTHHVKYTSAVDDIEIIHTAHNRTGFASGAIAAAAFIQHKKGVFTMQDVLGF